jgi:hypothetical protein
VVPSALLIATIGLTYSSLNPIICPFACLFFMLGLVVYKYNLCVTAGTPSPCDCPCVHSHTQATSHPSRTAPSGNASHLSTVQTHTGARTVVPAPRAARFARYLNRWLVLV